MRYLGQNYGTDVPLALADGRVGPAELAETLQRFAAEHARLYGYDIPDEIVELVTFKTSAVGVTEKPELAKLEAREALVATGERPVFFRGDGWLPTTIYDREAMPAGTKLAGPAIVEERMSTTLVHPGQTLEVDEFGNLILWPRGRQA